MTKCMVNKQEIIAAIQAAIQKKHEETLEKLNRLREQYNKDPRMCDKEEYIQKEEYLFGYCRGLMEACWMLDEYAE